MKVLHLLAGLGGASGVANIARRFARVQKERGEEVVMLAPRWKWNPIYFGLLFAIRAWWNARTADEIWVHCSWTFPVWYGAWMKGKGKSKSEKVKRQRLVVVPEGSFDPKRLHNHAGWKKRLVAPLDRWVLRQADEVFALCDDEIEWVKGFEPSAKVRFERVPLFMEKEGLGQRSRSTEDGDSLHVLFLGRAEDPLKGVRFLEQAVEELNHHCPPPPSTSTSIILRVISNHFGEELEKDWEWCDVLCLPTLSENFGLVVAEALERGKRVITTDGAPAWKGHAREEVEKVGGQWRERSIYLEGYRDGSDEKRVELLKAALASL